MKSALNRDLFISFLFALLMTNLAFAETKSVNQPDAVDAYNKAIELCPKDAMVYYNRGNAYFRLGHYRQAVADFDMAIELDPDLTAAYDHRGVAYKKLGNYKQAIVDFNKAIDLNPQYAAAYNNRGDVYGSFGDYKQSVADFDKAIDIDPKLAIAYNNRGFAYNNLGNHHQAIADYDKAIELDPNLAAAYHNRGAAYDSLGNNHKAIADYDRAVELSPQYAKASGNSDDQIQRIAGLGKVIEKNKSWVLAIIVATLAAGVLLFILKYRINSVADMRDGELITLIKEAAQEGQFARISRKEMEYIYHRGFALAAHRLYDDDLIKAVNQFKAEIERRKEASFARLSPDQETVDMPGLGEPHEVDEFLYEAILGEKNCIYSYLTKFKDFDWHPIDLKESWNWAAFLGGGIWALYRKMYACFLAFLGLAALCAILFMNGEYLLGFIVILFPWIVFSIYANSLYHDRVKKIIAAAQLSISDKSKLLEYLRYEGGVNTWVIWIGVLLPAAGILAAILFQIVKH